ncbi:MAG: GntR family transcriptional regulator [Burkholderiales bacterium]|jgi:DNA-binding GntR family transcriptional regulator|nr:GntR family transcriptional regulator [Burkholderiales bacterium]
MESLKPQKTLVEQVYERILDAICEGALPAGTRVTQDELAERLQVSRQPVMTAMGLLKQQGFLVEHGRRGLQVAPADRARFDAIYEFRSAVEPLAASLAAQRITPQLLERGRALIAQGRRMAASGDAHATLQADIDFHGLIYEASGNPLLQESMQLHWQHLRRSMGEVLQRARFTQKVWREHAAILDAIAAGDARAAAELIAGHVREARERVGAELVAAERAVA